MGHFLLTMEAERRARSGCSPQRESSIQAEALGALELAQEPAPWSSTMCPGWRYKSESKADGPGSGGEGKATLGSQGTQAGLGLGADMPTGSGNGLENGQNVFVKGGTLQGYERQTLSRSCQYTGELGCQKEKS